MLSTKIYFFFVQRNHRNFPHLKSAWERNFSESHDDDILMVMKTSRKISHIKVHHRMSKHQAKIIIIKIKFEILSIKLNIGTRFCENVREKVNIDKEPNNYF